MKPYRIISLIPSATEILTLLHLTEYLVGRSHECDYPGQVKQLPICTAPKFDPEGTSAQIHDRVTDILHSTLSVYQVKLDIIEQLQPTHILTQAQCEVCAVSLADVEIAVASLTSSQPQIISLQPNTLADVWADIQQVAHAFNVDSNAAVTSLQARVEDVVSKTRSISDRPTVVCIEWIEPLMAAGNWIPELVEMAGGVPLFGTTGKHSPWMTWEELLASNPDTIAIMPCGFDLERTRQESKQLSLHPMWRSLSAVKNGQVYITDGNSYFNRPGPRLVNSLEILAEIFHPQLFEFGMNKLAWQQYC